jgi:hypothetical protein
MPDTPALEDRRASFDAKMCTCGHTYGRHPWYDNPRRNGACVECSCNRRYDAEVAAEQRQRAAIAADPNHVHGPTNTAYACPGFIPFQVCAVCGETVESEEPHDA